MLQTSHDEPSMYKEILDQYKSLAFNLQVELQIAQEKLDTIQRYCMSHNHPGVNTGGHAAVNAILRIIGNREVAGAPVVPERVSQTPAE